MFKSFSYLPFSILSERDNRFPLDLSYIIASFLDKNDKTLKNFHKYFDKLMKEKKYIGILSENDCNLIKGFTDSYFIYSFGDIKKSPDILTALSFSEYLEATYKLIYVYLERLKKMKEDKVKEELISLLYSYFAAVTSFGTSTSTGPGLPHFAMRNARLSFSARSFISFTI